MRCDLENTLRQVQEFLELIEGGIDSGTYIESIRQLRERINQVRNGTAMPVAQLQTAYISLMVTAAVLATSPKEHPTTSEDLAYFQGVMEQGADAIAEVLKQLGIPLPSPSKE